MNIKLAICDDAQNQIEYVASLVSSWSTNKGYHCVVHTFPSAEAFLFEYEDDKTYDILLLDIEMGKMNGIDLAKNIRQTNDTVQIVFITGFPDFIAEGYDVSALHYLMKPVSQEKLHSVLDKAAANLKKAEKRLCITFDRQVDYISLGQIMYIEAQKQYVDIYSAEKCYRMKSSLSEIEANLDEFFFKCQRSFIVNLKYIMRINTNCVVLKNGTEIPISRGMAEKIGKEIIRLF